MYAIYYTMGLIICLPYILYIVIKNNGNLMGTFQYLTTTWRNNKGHQGKYFDNQYTIRIILFFLFIGLALIGSKYDELFIVFLAIIFFIFIIYYMINPSGVVKHIIFHLKELYPLHIKEDNK